MTAINQSEFIARVKEALGYAIDDGRPSLDQLLVDAPESYSRTLENIQNRSADDRIHLVNLLIAQAKPINLKVTVKKDTVSVSQAIKKLVLEKNPEWGTQKRVAAWKHPLIERLRLPEILADENVPVNYTALRAPAKDSSAIEVQRAEIRRQVTGSYIGVTSADYCVASTATLFMRDRPGQARSVSLLPLIHVAVIELTQIISDLKELYILLDHNPREKTSPLSNCMTCITGPSKTGDIELVMVHGAHGPRELYLFVITG